MWHSIQPHIVLLHCPPETIEFPPRAEAYLASKLKSLGLDVSVIDMNLQLWHQSKPKYKSAWFQLNEHYWHDQDRLNSYWKDNKRAIRRLLQAVVKLKPAVLFMNIEFPKEYFACEIIKRLKQEHSKMTVVVGGLSCFSEEQRQALLDLSDHSIDHFTRRDTEDEFIVFLHQLTNTGKLPLRRRQVQRLDRAISPAAGDVQPQFPSYREFKLHQYRGHCLSISLGYGCTGSCDFCKRNVDTNRHHLRSADHVVAEIHSHQQRYGITNFYLTGAPIQSDLETLENICDALIADSTPISWSAEAAANRQISNNLLAKLRMAGCHTLIFCCVSGSAVLHSRMNTGFTPAEAEITLQKTAQAGLKVAAEMIVGFPGEYQKQLAENQEFTTRNKPPVIMAIKALATLKLYPGTRLFNTRVQHTIPSNKQLAVDRWTRSDGNSFYVRKRFQNQLIYHILGLHTFYNPHNLLIDIPHFSQMKYRDLPREIRYQLYNMYDPWHIYHSDPVSKTIINYVWRKTALVQNDQTDFPVIAGIKDGKTPFIGPETVHLDITNRCNYNCIACWDRSPLVRGNNAHDDYLQQTLSYERITGFIDDLVELGGTRFIKLGGGGEPTMHPRFRDIITYLRSKDRYVEIDINTNFSLINEKLLHVLLEQEVNLLTVSLWAASPEVYVRTHPNQTEATFTRIISNLKKATDDRAGNRVLKLFIHNVIMSLNHHEVEAMLELALDVCADEIHFTLVDPVPGKTDSLLLSHQQHMVVLDSLSKIKQSVNRDNIYTDPLTGRSIKITNFHEFFIKVSQPAVEQGIYDLKAANKMPCYIGWLYTRILADGRVVPCCKGHRLSMGDLYRKRFTEIWNSPTYRKFRYNGKYLDKSAPYFSIMGSDSSGNTGCINCDNIMHNTTMHDKFLCSTNLAKWFIFKLDQRRRRKPDQGPDYS